MATAINFNWVISEKVTDGKVYNFTFTNLDGEATDLEFVKIGNRISVRFADGVDGVFVDIFRQGMKVIDALALALKSAGRVTSGEVYRADLLAVVSSDYETREMYTGIHSPSHEFQANRPTRESDFYIGFELETAGRNSNCECALHNLKSNIWRQVSDGSIEGRNGANGIEFVSTLLHPADAVKPDFYGPFFDMLTGLAVSSSLPSTGLHCHISRAAFGEDEETQDENIAKLIYLENFVLSDRALSELYGRDASGRWARPNESATGFVSHLAAVAQYAPRVMSENGIRTALKTDLLTGNKSRRGHNYPSERYHRINITNPNTVEFRQGKGQIKSQALANIAQHAVTIAKYCKETPWHKLSARGYWQSIPTSAKYGEIKRIFSPSNDD